MYNYYNPDPWFRDPNDIECIDFNGELISTYEYDKIMLEAYSEWKCILKDEAPELLEHLTLKHNILRLKDSRIFVIRPIAVFEYYYHIKGLEGAPEQIIEQLKVEM